MKKKENFYKQIVAKIRFFKNLKNSDWKISLYIKSNIYAPRIRFFIKLKEKILKNRNKICNIFKIIFMKQFQIYLFIFYIFSELSLF